MGSAIDARVGCERFGEISALVAVDHHRTDRNLARAPLPAPPTSSAIFHPSAVLASDRKFEPQVAQSHAILVHLPLQGYRTLAEVLPHPWNELDFTRSCDLPTNRIMRPTSSRAGEGFGSCASERHPNLVRARKGAAIRYSLECRRFAGALRRRLIYLPETLCARLLVAMTYQVLARKWRPQDFSGLVGQASIVTALRNALTENRIAQAYVFSGIRGVGKTSTARVLAKALNCPVRAERGDADPCNECSSCNQITGGNDLNVIEVDAATYSKVEQVRELTETLRYAPTHGRYKVVVLDEVHRLSRQAFDALLKIVEEPPEHLVFISPPPSSTPYRRPSFPAVSSFSSGAWPRPH